VHDRTTCQWIAELLDRHGAALALYAQQWTDAAEDCVQEAFVELCRQAPPPDNVVAWLYRVVRNRAISRMRDARRRARREAIALQMRGPTQRDVAGQPPFGAEELTAAVEALPGPLREVVIARTWGGLTFEEIAALVGCSTSAAHRRYEAALAILRQKLGVLCTISQTNLSICNKKTFDQ
jgi:RNA polymerase sigma-70 factor (ECF subfamily)